MLIFEYSRRGIFKCGFFPLTNLVVYQEHVTEGRYWKFRQYHNDVLFIVSAILRLGYLYYFGIVKITCLHDKYRSNTDQKMMELPYIYLNKWQLCTKLHNFFMLFIE